MRKANKHFLPKLHLVIVFYHRIESKLEQPRKEQTARLTYTAGSVFSSVCGDLRWFLESSWVSQDCPPHHPGPQPRQTVGLLCQLCFCYPLPSSVPDTKRKSQTSFNTVPHEKILEASHVTWDLRSLSCPVTKDLNCWGIVAASSLGPFIQEMFTGQWFHHQHG